MNVKDNFLRNGKAGLNVYNVGEKNRSYNYLLLHPIYGIHFEINDFVLDITTIILLITKT